MSSARPGLPVPLLSGIVAVDKENAGPNASPSTPVGRKPKPSPNPTHRASLPPPKGFYQRTVFGGLSDPASPASQFTYFGGASSQAASWSVEQVEAEEERYLYSAHPGQQQQQQHQYFPMPSSAPPPRLPWSKQVTFSVSAPAAATKLAVWTFGNRKAGTGSPLDVINTAMGVKKLHHGRKERTTTQVLDELIASMEGSVQLVEPLMSQARIFLDESALEDSPSSTAAASPLQPNDFFTDDPYFGTD